MPRKGFEYFIEVCKENLMFKKDCIFVIVGDTLLFKQSLMLKLKELLK